MFKIDLKNRKPIYEQVMDNFKKLIIAGTLEAESKVPSIRDMAKTLSVNPNTVQRAYRELEAQGYIYTVIGQGSFIATPPESARKREVEALYVTLGNHANELIYRGETKDNIHQYIDKLGDKEDINNDWSKKSKKIIWRFWCAKGR